MNELVQTTELKTNYWQELSEQEGYKASLRYDTQMDTLFVYFSSREKDRIITHFVDDNVAFLYRYSDKQIIGMRIEDFENGFVPNDPTPKVWKLSDVGVKLNGLCDFIFCVEKIDIEKNEVRSFTTRRIEREIKALEPVFG